MALIIKGDMPSCCAVCCDCNSADDGNFCNRTGNRLRNDWQLYRPLNCPIIAEIPDRYGRLIDVDKLIASFRKWADAPIKRTNNEIADFLEEYSKDSTIVEATNE